VAPEDLAVSPDGAHVYVVNADEGTMSVIDTATNTVVGKPNPVGSFPASVAVSPDGSLAYFTNSGDGTLAVVDTATYEVVASLKVVATRAPGEGSLYAVALTPDGNRAYVTNYDTGNVPVISFV
jgi:YVTN family beta-propeller protein